MLSLLRTLVLTGGKTFVPPLRSASVVAPARVRNTLEPRRPRERSNKARQD